MIWEDWTCLLKNPTCPEPKKNVTKNKENIFVQPLYLHLADTVPESQWMISLKASRSRSPSHQDSHRSPWRCPRRCSSPGRGWAWAGRGCCWSSPSSCSSSTWLTSSSLSATSWFLFVTLAFQKLRIHPPCCRRLWLAPWLALELEKCLVYSDIKCYSRKDY